MAIQFGGPKIVKELSFKNEAKDKLIAGIDKLAEAALLDQRIVSGLGNIYVCESLWRAGINPKRLSGKISRKKIDVLVPIIRDVLREAISAGGSSLKDHRQTNGDLGYFQHSFAVYGREGKKCNSPDCSELIKRIVQSGRSSFYCAKCQK